MRHQRVPAYLLAGALLGGVSLLDLVHRGWHLPLFAVRMAWVVAVLGGAVAFRWGSDRTARLGELFIAAASPCFFFLAVELGGGAQSPHLPLVLAVPLGAAVLQQGNLAAVLTCSGMVTLGSGVLAVAHDGSDGLITVFAYTLVVSALSAYAAWSFRRARHKELAELGARELALERVSELERERAQSERLATVGRLAAGVAHEINNPLAYVRANLSWLREELAARGLEDAEMEEVLRDSEQGCVRMGEIVSALKLFAREDAQDLQPCRVDDVVEEALRLASVSITHAPDVVRELALDLPPVRAERRRLVQAVANLVVNAADALERLGGSQTPPCVLVRACPEAEGVRVDVEDNGPGLPPHLRARLFEPFFTTKPVGAGQGLGLALTREFIHQAGGRLSAEERAGGGARFSLWLPKSV